MVKFRRWLFRIVSFSEIFLIKFIVELLPANEAESYLFYRTALFAADFNIHLFSLQLLRSN